MSTPHEMQAFIDDFRCQKAESILKKLYQKVTGVNRIVAAPPPSVCSDSPTCSSVGSTFDENDFMVQSPPLPPVLDSCNLSELKINAVVFEAVCSVLEKQLKPYEDSYIDECSDSAATNKLVTDLEWELINGYSIFSSFSALPSIAPESVDAFLREKEENNTNFLTREKKKQMKIDADKREIASDEICKLRSFVSADLERIHRVLHGLRQHHRGQNALNGSGESANNMWIVKPAAKSRGRGIATFMDLSKLLRYVEAGSVFR